MKQRLLYITIILLLLGVLVSQLHFIPSFESWENHLFILIFSSAFIVGIIYLFKSWKQQKNKTRVILHTVVFLIVFPIAFLFTIPSIPMLKSEYIKTITQNNTTYYIYNEYCFPPDGACECDTYGSLIYVKNKYLPIMYLVVKTDFYVGTLHVNNEVLTVKASEECTKDQDKTLKINL